MNVKDLAILLILTIVLNGIAVVCCAMMLEKYHIDGTLKMGVTIYIGLSAGGIFFATFALIMKTSGLGSRLGILVIMLVGAFCVGTWIAGISYSKARWWTLHSIRKDPATFPIVFLSVSVGIQLAMVFMIIRGREKLKEWQRDGELPDVALSHLLCSSEFVSNNEPEDEFMEDPYFGRKRKQKPTFHNKGSQKKTRKVSSSEEDSESLLESGHRA